MDGNDLFESAKTISSENSETNVASDGSEKEVQSEIRNHPLFFGITMGILAEIINSR